MKSNSGAVLPWLIIIGAIVIILIGFWGWRGVVGSTQVAPSTTVAPQLQGQSPSAVLSIAAVTQDFNIFLDKTVSLRGSLSEWVTDRSFTISDVQSGWLPSTSQGILVLSSNQFDVPLQTPDDQIALGEKPQVFVRGPIQIFNADEFANQFNLRLEDRNELEAYDGRAVIVAEQLQKE